MSDNSTVEPTFSLPLKTIMRWLPIHLEFISRSESLRLVSTLVLRDLEHSRVAEKLEEKEEKGFDAFFLSYTPLLSFSTFSLSQSSPDQIIQTSR